MPLEVMSISIRRLMGDGDPYYWSYLELYVESFPREERLPLQEFAHKLSHGDGDTCALIAESSGEFAGLAYLVLARPHRIGFLVYLVTEPGHRGKGVGRQLVRACRHACDAAGCADGMLFECERPELSTDEADRTTRIQRVEWFREIGATLLDATYIQPSLGPGRPSVPLLLMGFVAEGVDPLELAARFRDHVVG